MIIGSSGFSSLTSTPKRGWLFVHHPTCVRGSGFCSLLIAMNTRPVIDCGWTDAENDTSNLRAGGSALDFALNAVPRIPPKRRKSVTMLLMINLCFRFILSPKKAFAAKSSGPAVLKCSGSLYYRVQILTPSSAVLHCMAVSTAMLRDLPGRSPVSRYF